ncbi:Mov34/MPN/PAD-1 family protein [Paenibacillus sp. Soil724D2]|uniref:Mov34/MPN/PAD-1 family protein n=1 Tax=Paenibacillus sp. (strain Soil724D2) TaxID=1736392 RepID=UPI00071237EB|nr:Mov34/MPN/PAD-1 family protein [Paenibacillus sp. Soil724D2]KRE48385.1 hypothetical protein ASG85_05120 [Paenibacillus sp. Soil724D2]
MEYKFGDRLLIFNPEVLKVFYSYRQVGRLQNEAGGILLGRIYKNEKIVIENISTPSSADKSGRYFFERNVQKAQMIVNRAWEESNGEITYLGEWHTHPEAIPTPSTVDKKLLTNMLIDTKMENDYLFLVIVGISGYYIGSQHKGKNLEQLMGK